MGDPVLHLLAGPNGSGKSTLWALVLEPVLHLEFVNADEIDLISSRTSFATETVFSHASKVDLVSQAVDAGYLVTLHVVAVPPDLAVARVENRVENGGHAVPAVKVRQRYDRLWGLVVAAARLVEHVEVYDNSTAARPFRLIAELDRGAVLWSDWPTWTPAQLTRLG